MGMIAKIVKNMEQLKRISPEKSGLRKFLGVIGINSTYYVENAFSVSYDGTVRVALKSVYTEDDNEIWELFDFCEKWDNDVHYYEVSYAGKSYGLSDTAFMPKSLSEDEIFNISLAISDLKEILSEN